MMFEDKLWWYRAKLDRVTDGDTVVLIIDQGLDTRRLTKVRMDGIDTPETRGTSGDERVRALEAKERLTQLLEDAKKSSESEWYIWVHTRLDKTGKYGRLLGTLYIEGADGTPLNINQFLLDEGLADRW